MFQDCDMRLLSRLIGLRWSAGLPLLMAIAAAVALTWMPAIWGTPAGQALAQVSAQATVVSTADATQVLGEATFSETATGLEMSATLSNVSPGLHGFHIHAAGSCADGGKGAGGHYNPLSTEHGYLPGDGLGDAHAGDMGNILIAADGSGSLTVTLPGLTLAGDAPFIQDRAVILHAKPDDFGQPTGNAGGRVGCGIIAAS